MLLKKFHKQQGFSLIEVLVTLSILGIILTIFFPISNSLLETKTEEKVFDMFQYDVLFLQNKSMGTNNYTRMVLKPNGYTITDHNTILIERELPDGWEIDPRNLVNISFNRSGAIRNAGTIKIVSPKNTYNVIFPIGKGRGYIEKQ